MNTKDNKNIYRYNLLTKKLLRGEASTEEMKELSEWEIVSDKMKSQLSQAATDEANEEIGKRIWKKIDKKCNNTKQRSLLRPLHRQMIAAACTILFLAAGTFWLFQKEAPTAIEKYTTIIAKSSRFYILPDDSKVWMQAGSSIRFNQQFTTGREIWLAGESTFEVTKRNEEPFKVHIDPAFVEVKGTVFQVRNRKKEQSEVTLFSGKVDFNTTTGKKIEMSPRQRVIYQPAKDDITIKDIGNISWEDGLYKFTDIPLDSLIEVIEDIYDTPVALASGINRKHLFTGAIKYDDPILKVIEKICFNMHRTYTLQNENILIH